MVRTSRCGRDNPGSTPGVVMQVRRTAEIHGTDRMPDTPASMSGVGHAYAFQTGAQSARAAARAHMTSISCPTGSGGLRHSGVPGHQSLLDHYLTGMLTRDSRPHRLVVRTSRCGRDNPGSIPGVVMPWLSPKSSARLAFGTATQSPENARAAARSSLRTELRQHACLPVSA